MKARHLTRFVLLLSTTIVSVMPASQATFALSAPGAQVPQNACRTFPETAQTVCGRFLEYWEQNGGLAQQGYPLSNEMRQKSKLDGKTYTVQYFERAIFESHPENEPPYDVLLGLLGAMRLRNVYGRTGTPPQAANQENPRFFPETSKTVGGAFRAYWEENGGLAQYGYPLTNEFQEQSFLNGKTYTVQYFERAVFEFHPENQPPHHVLLTQLGKQLYDFTRPTTCIHLVESEGSIIAEGTNTVAADDRYKLKSYFLEEIIPIAPLTCEVSFPDSSRTKMVAETRTFDKYWRLTLTADLSGEHLFQGAYDSFMWLDRELLGRAGTRPARPGPNGKSYALLHSTLVFDLSFLRDGATPWIGYAGREAALPETLNLSAIR